MGHVISFDIGIHHPDSLRTACAGKLPQHQVAESMAGWMDRRRGLVGARTSRVSTGGLVSVLPVHHFQSSEPPCIVSDRQ